RTVRKLRAALTGLAGYRFRYLDDHAALYPALRAAKPDLVLNLCDEGFNNDATMEGHVPALLDVMGLPYSGAGPQCLVTCYDKSLVTAVAASLGIAVPQEIAVSPEGPLAARAWPSPALVKPCLGDNSVGIDERSVVRGAAEVNAAVQRMRTLCPGRPVLVQEYLSGGEYSV